MSITRRPKKPILAIIVLLALNLSAPLALSSPVDEKQTQLNTINSQIQAVKGREADAARKQAEVGSQLQLSSDKLVEAQKKINDLQIRLNATITLRHDVETKLNESQRQLDESELKLGVAKRRLAAHKRVFEKRLEGAYMSGGTNLLQFVFESRSITDLIARVGLVRLVAESDSRMIRNIKQLTASIAARIEQIETVKRAIEERQKKVVAEEDTIKALTGQMVAAQDQLQQEAARQQQAYDQIGKEKAGLAASESALQANSNAIAGQIALENGGRNSGADVAPAELRNLAASAAAKYAIPAKLFFALITQESGWNYQSVSRSGAIGLTQIMPYNAVAMGYDLETFRGSPSEQLEAGAIYLSRQYTTFGRWDFALAAYNAGPGAVMQYGGIPPYPETQNYVRNILAMAGPL